MHESIQLKRQPNVARDDQILKPLLAANIAALSEGKAVLESLDDVQFRSSCKPAFQSTLGAHYRHLLEHYVCFLKSTQHVGSLICYDSRKRDVKIEQNRAYALQALDQVVAELCAFEAPGAATGEGELGASALEVGSFEVRDHQMVPPLATSLARELLFLQAHTVHHHAIIAAMCRILEHTVPENFGVAIATQAFIDAQKNCSSEHQPQEGVHSSEVNG